MTPIRHVLDCGYCAPALHRVDAVIQQAQRDDLPEVRFIVGKGIHAVDGRARIKPAVLEALQK